MPRNLGGKSKRRYAKDNNNDKRLITYKDVDQAYAQVLKALGGANFHVKCDFQKPQDPPMIGHLRGSLRKRGRIVVGNVVLVSLRDFQTDRCDIIHRYNDDETRQLIKQGLVNFECKETQDTDDVGFVFEDSYNDNVKTRKNDSDDSDGVSSEDDFDIDAI